MKFWYEVSLFMVFAEPHLIQCGIHNVEFVDQPLYHEWQLDPTSCFVTVRPRVVNQPLNNQSASSYTVRQTCCTKYLYLYS